MENTLILDLHTNNKSLDSSNHLALERTFNAIMDFFSFIKNKSEATKKAYKDNLINFYKWLLANKVISTSGDVIYPDRQDIINYQEHLKEESKEPTTINSYLTTIKSFTTYLYDEALIDRNPYHNIDRLRVSKDFKKDYLNESQLASVLNRIDRSKIKGLRDYAMILVAYTGGLRTIEITRLLYSDIQDKNGCKVLYLQRKGHLTKDKYIKLPYQVMRALDRYLETRTNLTPDSPLFIDFRANKEETPLLKESVSRIFKQAFRKSGLDSSRITQHSIRHSTATNSLKNGSTIEQVREVLGHEDIRTTMIYTHLIEREKNNTEINNINELDKYLID